MGKLIDGIWHDIWYPTDKSKGQFTREGASIRNWITADGQAGPSGVGGFAAEANRYHLYVSLACPWAHRTLIFRQLKGLQALIDVSVVSPIMLQHGWTFDQAEGSSGDKVHGFDYCHQLYTAHAPTFTGRTTVPILWDCQRGVIVNNESSEIIRMFNQAFDHLTGNTLDFYPEPLRQQIDDINELVYHAINNGVYKTGFATSQTAYEEAWHALFAALDRLEDHLAKHTWLVGQQITEADWRLFTTLIRFDSVYFGHFKCNKRPIESYPHLANYVRDLYQQPGVAETVDFTHIKSHYYASHRQINPTGIVPLGPEIDYTSKPNRRQAVDV